MQRMDGKSGGRNATGHFQASLAKWVAAIATMAAVLVGLLVLCRALYDVFAGEMTEALAYLTAGIVLLLVASIDRFEYLKTGGFEAKTRQVDAKIREADATLEALRRLAELSCRSIIATSVENVRFELRRGDEVRIASGYETASSVRRLLRELEISETDIRKILKPWAELAAAQALCCVARNVSELLSKEQELATNRMEVANRNGDKAEIERQRQLSMVMRNKAIALNRWSRFDPVAPDEAARQLQVIREVAADTEDGIKSAVDRKIDGWAARLNHLAEAYDLDDVEAWYTLRPYAFG
jgi:hypothetical protein